MQLPPAPLCSLNRTIRHWHTGVGAILVIAPLGSTASSGANTKFAPTEAPSSCTNLIWSDLVVPFTLVEFELGH
jgi:hypothetical protein